jgi:hypothetical protein
MNQLSTAERVRIISCLVEGVSQRAAVRMTGSAKKTVANMGAFLHSTKLFTIRRNAPSISK